MRGQGSIEIILIAAIILAVSVVLMNYYRESLSPTIAVAVVRQDVDSYLQDAKLEGCYGELSKIEVKGNTIHAYVTNCNSYIDTAVIANDVRLVSNAKYNVVIQ